MRIRPRSTAEQHHRTAARPAERPEAHPAQEAKSTPEPAALTWTRAQLRERIQQTGAALAPAAEPADRRTREPEHSPAEDREIEP
jgi:hypothetical protein